MKGRSLERRLQVIEGGRGRGQFSHLSDDELKTELAALCELIEASGSFMPDNWREAIAGDDLRGIGEIESAMQGDLRAGNTWSIGG